MTDLAMLLGGPGVSDPFDRHALSELQKAYPDSEDENERVG